MMPVHRINRELASSRLAYASTLLVLLLSAMPGSTLVAETLDEAVAQDSFLLTLADALHVYDIDVAHNLNARDVARGRIQRPRLGRFPDLPVNSLPLSQELAVWEGEYEEGEIGAIAILGNGPETDSNAVSFLHDWLRASGLDRLFVSFHSSDLDAADKIASVAGAYGFRILTLHGGESPAMAGNLYATAAQRLAIDSRAARRYRSEVTEFSYLGERVRRNSNSLFRDGGDRGNSRLARSEPSVFLKETLGGEFTQSTIREIIVPGGVALGETATLTYTIASMVYGDGVITLIGTADEQFVLPQIDTATLRALFDFVERSEAIRSDAIVDIDADGRVKISSALRDTDPGFDIVHADTLPFEYVPNLSVTKSVIIDTGVDWYAGRTETLAFQTDFEVRFLSADNMRIAQTRVALEYQYDSQSGEVSYLDSWGRDRLRLRDNLDYAGLGEGMRTIASYAGWIGLLRKMREEQVPFLQGRYEFLKLDKSGRDTPARY
ncbi:MAG TPA: hypothetical protein DCM64_05140 [Gammaproteobacteria bacterium]|jgi:hypothetical protein|nr:hypothetical protein [Gammaproteobacteria bacterium]